MLTRRGSTRVLADPETAEWVVPALLDGAGCRRLEVPGGRGHLVEFPVRDGWAVIRTFQRGGLLQGLNRDAYLLINRPLRELKIHSYLHEAGVPVPVPLGVRWERRGLWVRGAIASSRLEAQDLLSFLHTQAGDKKKWGLQEAAKTMRAMHDAGVFHADLQLRNILIGKEGAYLIDFDKGRRLGHVSDGMRARNLLRLRRSFDKCGCAPEWWGLLRDAYGALSIPAWLDAAYRLKGKGSDRLAGRSTQR